MKYIKLTVSFVLTIAVFYALNTKLGVAPPIGKFLDPAGGIWQNDKNAIIDGNINIQDLSAPVTIHYDEQLIPHIFAQNDLDLYKAQGYITAKHRTDSTRLIRIKIIHAEMKKGEYEGDLNDVIVSLRKITLADEAYPILPKAMGDDQENSIAELNEQKSLEQRKSYDEPKGEKLSRKQDFFNPFAPNATANSKIEIRSEKAKEAVSKGFSTRKKKKPAPSNPFARKE